MISYKISSDGVPIDSGTFATILGGITIWNPWSNESDANLEDCLHSTSVVILLNTEWLEMVWNKRRCL